MRTRPQVPEDRWPPLRGIFAAAVTVIAAGTLAGTALAGPALARAVPASAASGLPAGCSQSGTTVTCRYSATGAEQVFAVPAGITKLSVSADGAPGAVSADAPTGPAGTGEHVTGTVRVTAGSSLYVEVGGSGGGETGGFNGGGSTTHDGGGGGGASDVRTVGNAQTATTLASRLLVAGGGGGSGADSTCSVAPTPVAGGGGGNAGTNGGNGTLCSNDVIADSSPGGTMGTIATGGTGGTTSIVIGGTATTATPAGNGALGTGGSSASGGGGGGGYYGGGGGGNQLTTAPGPAIAGAGGGGGSSLVPSGGSSAASSAGAGSVTVSYTVVQRADLSVKVRGPKKATGGRTFKLTIIVTNHGPQGALGLITVADVPTRHLALVRARGTSSSSHGVLIWTATRLRNQGTDRYVFTLRARRGFAGSVTVHALVSSTRSTDPKAANNAAAFKIRITR